MQKYHNKCSLSTAHVETLIYFDRQQERKTLTWTKILGLCGEGNETLCMKCEMCLLKEIIKLMLDVSF